MGAGSWNDNGRTPAHFCAWAKSRLNWIRHTVVRNTSNLKLSAAEQDRASIYHLWTNGKLGSEYFLIENRQLVGFDRKLPQGGLLIWRVDDTNHNNDHAGDYWVGLNQADGLRDLELGRNRGDRGDPYPGSSDNTRFDATSDPNASDHLGRATGVSVIGIRISGSIVACKVKV
jgi:immune inhibitor A